MNRDLEFLELAIIESEKAPVSPDRYRVGAVIVNPKGQVLATGFTGESSPSAHAEEVALAKLQGSNLEGTTIYSSMEPCSQRKSSPESCSQLIIEAGITRVVYALEEPDKFVICVGRSLLKDAGIEVVSISELAKRVSLINSHLNRAL